MRVAFDKNIYISAVVIPGGLVETAVLKTLDGQDLLLLSKDILDEILSVLSSKFSRDREDLSRVAVFLSEISEWVLPGKRLQVFQDEPDNRILECAVTGRADVIVTGDKAILRLGEYQGIKVMSLKE